MGSLPQRLRLSRESGMFGRCPCAESMGARKIFAGGDHCDEKTHPVPVRPRMDPDHLLGGPHVAATLNKTPWRHLLEGKPSGRLPPLPPFTQSSKFTATPGCPVRRSWADSAGSPAVLVHPMHFRRHPFRRPPGGGDRYSHSSGCSGHVSAHGSMWIMTSAFRMRL